MSRKSAPRASNNNLLLLISVAAAIGFVALLIVFVMQTATPAGIGPRLTVDQERIDFGRVKYEQPVRAVFTLRNTGDQPLRISETRIPTKLLEGC